MKMLSKTIQVVTLAAIVGFVALPATASAQSWRWSVTPYAWFPGAGLDIKINDSLLSSNRTSFQNLKTNVKMAASVHVEGQNGVWGILFDGLYADLGTANDNKELIAIRNDVKSSIFEVAGTYTPSGTPEGFSAILGTRIYNIAETLDLRGTLGGHPKDLHYSVSPTLLDFMIGGRYVHTFGGNWMFNLRGDYSTGGTDYALNGVAGLGYSFGDSGRYTLLGGYRYFDMKFKDKKHGAEVTTEMTLDGPYLAFSFGF